MKFKIYQLPIEHGKVFSRHYREDVSLSDYKEVWSGEVESGNTYSVLEGLFTEFNIDHPEGYRARSLSCSDVVALEIDEEWKYFFCESFGWKEIEDISRFAAK